MRNLRQVQVSRGQHGLLQSYPHTMAFLITMILLQNMRLLACNKLPLDQEFPSKFTNNQQQQKQQLNADDIFEPQTYQDFDINGNFNKPTSIGEDINKDYIMRDARNNDRGQPEEIFSLTDPMENNEYPIVVPKRSALLLDRLMVALHNALEKNRTPPPVTHFRPLEERNRIDQTGTPLYQMYSDDDPNGIMDYDFKDLNSIHRATGETLMAKSFQRRTKLGVNLGSNRVALLTAASGDNSGPGKAARTYWRCYFNAVTCF